MAKLPPIVKSWREAAKRRATSAADVVAVPTGSRGIGGVSFQLPPDWGRGVKGIRHAESGPFKGRVVWGSRKEAQEVARIQSDIQGRTVLYDP